MKNPPSQTETTGQSDYDRGVRAGIDEALEIATVQARLMADLALEGLPESTRNREAMEAALTRFCDTLRVTLEGLAAPTPLQSEETDAAINLGVAVLTRIENPAVREIAIRNALTSASQGSARAGLKGTSEPTERMLLAGSMVAWGKYGEKTEAARDVWNVMHRNAPSGGEATNARRDISILLAQIDYLQETFSEELSEEDAGIVMQIRETWSQATSASQNVEVIDLIKEAYFEGWHDASSADVRERDGEHMEAGWSLSDARRSLS